MSAFGHVEGHPRNAWHHARMVKKAEQPGGLDWIKALADVGRKVVNRGETGQAWRADSENRAEWRAAAA